LSAAAGTDYFKGETIVNTADSATAYDYLMWDMPNTNDAASEDNYIWKINT
jgi:hypothetical protein